MGTLRFKIIAFLMLITSISIVGTSFFSVKSFIQKKEQELIESVTLRNMNLVSFVKQQIQKDKIDLTSLPKHIWRSGGIHAGLYGVGGVLLYGENTEVGRKLFKELEQKALQTKTIVTHVLDKNIILSFASIHKEQQLFAIAQTRMDNASIILEDTAQSIWLWVLVLMIITLLLAFSFSVTITNPLEELTRFSIEIGNGNYAHSNIFSKRKDEIGILTRSFKTMIEKIVKREKEIIEKNQELALSEKLATLGQFSAGIAHEIKNPLGSIRGNAQLFERQLRKEELNVNKCLELSHYIVQEVDRASDILTDILSFSRQDKLDLEVINIKKLLHEFYEIQKASIEQRGVLFNLDLDQDTNLQPQVNADNRRLKQVFSNIISNGIDAMEEQGNKEIRMDLLIETEKVVIKIQDSGPGIREEYLPRLFDPFFTTKTMSKGTGLGLSICHGIIKGHGGKIYVTSKEGSGTTFHLELPVVQLNS